MCTPDVPSYLQQICRVSTVYHKHSSAALSLGEWTRSAVIPAGDDEALRLAVSACLGMFVKHSSAEEARQVLVRGPLGPPAPSKGDRINHALVLAAIARSAPERYV